MILADHATLPFRIAARVLLAALVATFALFAGTAYAYEAGSGAGSGNAAVETVHAIAITSGVPTTTLVPGGRADLALVVTNPNPFALTVTSVAGRGGPVMVAGGTGCDGTDATVRVSTETGLDLVLAHGQNTLTIATGAVMGPNSPTGCQHATFDIPVELTAQQ